MLRGPYSLLRMLPRRCCVSGQPGLPALCTTAVNNDGKKTSAVIFDMGGVLLPSPLLLFKSRLNAIKYLCLYMSFQPRHENTCFFHV